MGHSANDEFRNKNLAYTLGYYYKKCPYANIVLVEQNTNTILKEDPRITHIKLPTNTLYNRGKGFNEGMKHVTKNNVLLIDNDCVIDPTIINSINNHLVNNVFIPYNYCIDLNKMETDHLMKTNRVIGGKSRGIKNACVGGALFISREAFDKVGGYEEFVGWGAEDECMFHKLNLMYGIARIQGEFPMFHLYHPSSASTTYLNSDFYKKNVELSNKIKSMDKSALIEYLHVKNM